MKSSRSKALLSLALGCLIGGGNAVSAQESITSITPLHITSGLNADVIAQQKATQDADFTNKNGETVYYKDNGTQPQSETVFTSKYATFIDQDSRNGGRNAFFSTGVQATGAIKVKAVDGHDGKYYLDGNTDSYPYLMQNVETAGNNALKLTNGQSGELAVTDIDGNLPKGSSYLNVVATSAAGSSQITVTAYGQSGEQLGTGTATIGDWWSGDASTKVNDIYNVQRITVRGIKNRNGVANGTSDWHINYVNKGGNNTTESFCLQCIKVPLVASEPIAKIKIEMQSVDQSKKESCAVIFAVTAITEEVTLKDTETSLSYLKNTTTNAQIAEGMKYKVNFHRTFNNSWNALVFNCRLTVAQAKAMFGQDIKLSVATDRSFQGNRVVFFPVDLTSADATAIEPGKYYLISGVTISENVDAETQVPIYSHTYLSYLNPKAKTGDTSLATAPADFTVTNTDGSGTTITFHGTYVAGTQTGSDVFALSGGRYYRYTTSQTLKGFRFWFTAKDSDGSQSNASSFSLDMSNETVSGIETAQTEAETATCGVRTLDGRTVRPDSNSTEGLPAGLYIVGGRKVFVK